MKLAFIGLGNMGYPMAGHLAQKGHTITVYNRTESKAIQWTKDYHQVYVPTIQQAVNNADVIFTCVGNDDDLSQVVLAEDGMAVGAPTNSTCGPVATQQPKIDKKNIKKYQVMNRRSAPVEA